MISIIIPNYNKSNYIVESIDSIKEQTSNNWECIIIDDCSTDNSVLTIKSVIKNDDRFRLYINNKNRGGAFSRNIGIKKSSGKYIVFLDSDDILNKNCIQYRFNKISTSNKLDFLVFPMNTFYQSIGDSSMVWDNFKDNHLQRFLSHDLPWHTMMLIWRKEFLIKLGGFNVEFKRCQDVELHTRALMDSNVKYDIFTGFSDCYFRISDERINNIDHFILNDLNGKAYYINYFRKILSKDKLRFLKGTIFEAYVLINTFYYKSKISKIHLNKFINYFENSINYELNLVEKNILNLYVKYIYLKIRIKGINRIFKFFFIY